MCCGALLTNVELQLAHIRACAHVARGGLGHRHGCEVEVECQPAVGREALAVVAQAQRVVDGVAVAAAKGEGGVEVGVDGVVELRETPAREQGRMDEVSEVSLRLACGSRVNGSCCQPMHGGPSCNTAHRPFWGRLSKHGGVDAPDELHEASNN